MASTLRQMWNRLKLPMEIRILQLFQFGIADSEESQLASVTWMLSINQVTGNPRQPGRDYKGCQWFAPLVNWIFLWNLFNSPSTFRDGDGFSGSFTAAWNYSLDSFQHQYPYPPTSTLVYTTLITVRSNKSDPFSRLPRQTGICRISHRFSGRFSCTSISLIHWHFPSTRPLFSTRFLMQPIYDVYTFLFFFYSFPCFLYFFRIPIQFFIRGIPITDY